jgi:hypothetical protein
MPEAKLCIKVLGEDGQPMVRMPVHVWLSESVILDGQTDAEGAFVAQGKCTIKDVPITIRQDGYYDSRLVYRFPNYMSVKDGRWQPWNPVVTAMVRRVGNPIPMYAKTVEAAIPVLDEFIGFDLVACDWVAPHGSGAVGDFQFKMRKRFVSRKDFDSSLQLRMTNAADGIQEVSRSSFQGSAYRLPRIAPAEGYGTSFDVSESSTNYLRPNEDQSFLFRVRSATNADGKIAHALYGKIGSSLRLDVRHCKTGVVAFTYCLNPTPNDRNLESDPKRNLLLGVKSTEEVVEP